jgi:hypothetical protein
VKLAKKTVRVELLYRQGESHPENGHFAGGVETPRHLDELAVWVDEEEKFDIDRDALVPTGDLQVQISGSRRALYEFGKYLVALSQLETEDPAYHDHFDELCELRNKRRCKLLVRLQQ